MSAAETAAANLGKRAGETFARDGVPARNPFQGKNDELAKPWRRAYMAAAKPKKARAARRPDTASSTTRETRRDI